MRIPLRGAIEPNAARSIFEATISFRAMCYNVGVREKTGQHPAVMRFVGVAKTFCGVLEKKYRSKRRFVEQVLNATVALYGAGLELPDISPEPSYKPRGDWFELIREHRRQYDRIRQRTVANLGGDQPYQQVFNPFDSDEAPVVATLSDDLSDIYCDVEKGLLRAKKDSQVVSASVIWQWKFDLQSHWGRHAVSAMNALHVLAFDK